MQTTNDVLNSPDMNEVLIKLGSFLAWALYEDAYFGATSSKEAIDALQILLGWDDAMMDKFISIFLEPMK